MNQKHEHNIQQILVALDSSPASLRALEQAVELAASFGAKVQGIFVEDINLVRLAEMSFTQEVGLFSARRRRLEIRYVERQFRGQASKARRALASLAQQADIDWSFRVARGVITTELLTAAAEADLIIMGRVGLSPQGRRRMGSTARAILLQATQLTLIHPRSDVHPGLPVMVFFDGTAVARRALVATAQLVKGRNAQLTVLLLADSQEAAQTLQQQARQTLQPYDLAAHYLWQSSAEVRVIVQKIQMEGCQMLVLPGNGSHFDRDTILPLLDKIECPVLLVR